MKAYLKLIRWQNLLIMGATMFLVRHYLIRQPLLLAGADLAVSPLNFGLLVMAMLLISAAGYVINDVFDMDIDSLNKAGGQTVGVSVSVKAAKNLYWILNGLALVFGVYLGYLVHNWQFTIILAMIAGLLWFYSERYKRQVLLGNLVVAFIAAAGIIIVWLLEFFYLRSETTTFIEVAGVMPLMSGLVFAYALFAFLSTFAREVVKDLQDMPGDARFGCRTLPVVYGESASRNFGIGLLAILVVMIGFWQYVLYIRQMYTATYVLLIADAIGIAALIRLALSSTPAHYKQVSSLIKLLMLAGLVSIVFLQSQ